MDFRLPENHRKACFRAIYSKAALHQAALHVYTKPLFMWRKALTRSHDNRTLFDFARHTSRNIAELHRRLVSGEIYFRPAAPVHYNFNGKHRILYIFPWEERIIDRLLYHELNRYFDAAFSNCAYAYRHRGFGLDVCQRRIAMALAQGKPAVYFVKRDIANYFGSVDHDLLLWGLTHWIEPRDYLYQLLLHRVRFAVRTERGTETMRRGIPFGSAVSCFFANLYLTAADRATDQIGGVRYFRYADDMLLFGPERQRVMHAGANLDQALRELKLESKPTHHRSFAFLKPGECDCEFEPVRKFRHLGLEFRVDGSVGLSRDKARKLRNLFRFAFRRARRRLRRASGTHGRAMVLVEVARQVVENGFRSVAIIDYYLKHVDDEAQLKLLDRWLAEEVLARALQTGHRKGNFRHLSFAKLRRMGLPCLRHRRRLLRHGHLKSSFFELRTEKLLEREGRRLPGRKTFSPGLEAAAETNS